MAPLSYSRFARRQDTAPQKLFQPNRDLLWQGGRRMRVHDPRRKARVFQAALAIGRKMRIRCAWIVAARDEDALLAEDAYGQRYEAPELFH